MFNQLDKLFQGLGKEIEKTVEEAKRTADSAIQQAKRTVEEAMKNIRVGDDDISISAGDIMIGVSNPEIEGQRLPEEFEGCTMVLGRFAFTADGKKFAQIVDGKPTIEDMSVGKITIHDKIGKAIITYEKTDHGVSVGVKGQNGESTISITDQGSVSVHNITSSPVRIHSRVEAGEGSGKRRPRKTGPQQYGHCSYPGINQVIIDNAHQTVELGISDDDEVHIGACSQEPKADDGTLQIRGLEGKLLLPKGSANMQTYIAASSGSVKGTAIYPGRITTVSGKITLDLKAPLTVSATSQGRAGSVDVRQMMSEGAGGYTPPGIQPIGTLTVETVSGNISVSYIAQVTCD